MVDANADRSFASEINTIGFVICKGNNENGELEVPFNSAYDYNRLALRLNHSCAIRRANQTVMCLGQNKDDSIVICSEDLMRKEDNVSFYSCDNGFEECVNIDWEDEETIEIEKKDDMLTKKVFTFDTLMEGKLKTLGGVEEGYGKTVVQNLFVSAHALGDFSSTLVIVYGASTTTYDVNADRSFASEINTTGFVICKGNNENGELEVPFNSAYDYNRLALGLNHSCAIRRANQTVMCLGQNSEFSSSLVGGVPFESIVSGSDFTCGLRTNKFLVVCWGPG
nr:putative serine/threonine-protein kinase-like protein CCR3 [Ipomoea batatas]